MVSNRPIGTSLIGIIAILTGVLGLIAGILLILLLTLSVVIVPGLSDLLPFTLLWAGIICTISLVLIFSGIGLLKQERWAWGLTLFVSMAIVALSVLVFRYLTTCGVIFGIVVIIYLVLVRDRFV